MGIKSIFSKENLLFWIMPFRHNSPESIYKRVKWYISLYFILLAAVIAYHLRPLPEQKPVIEFWAFLGVLYCVVFAVVILRRQNRWIILSLIPGLAGLAWVIREKNRYLAMALEDSFTLKHIYWAFIPIVILLLLPQTYRVFKDWSWSQRPNLIFFKKGLHF